MADETPDTDTEETPSAAATFENAPDAGGAAERVLNQDEIDSPAGFDVNSEQMQDKSGVRAIINSALVSYERLPMLEIVFDRLVRLMTTSLRNFTSDNVEVSLDSITSIRFGDYLNSIPLPAILAVFHAEELDNYGLFTVDSNLIYSIVDVLLGGRRGSSAMRIEGRPYTTIERTPGPAHDRSDHAGHVHGVRTADPGELQPRPPGDQSAFRRHRAPRPMPPFWSSCASTWKTAAGAPNFFCPMRRWSPSASCFCSSSWAKSSVATRSGKAIWRRNCVHQGRYRSHSGRADHAAEPGDEPGSRPDHDAGREPRLQDPAALRRRAAAHRADGPGRLFGRGAGGRSH